MKIKRNVGEERTVVSQDVVHEDITYYLVKALR